MTIKLRNFKVTYRECKRCGRVGSRQFSPAPSGGFVCFSYDRCMERIGRADRKIERERYGR